VMPSSVVDGRLAKKIFKKIADKFSKLRLLARKASTVWGLQLGSPNQPGIDHKLRASEAKDQ
jgi:hypothetical protein